MYFDTSILRLWCTILFQRLLPKLGSQAHLNTMCFSFPAKMCRGLGQAWRLLEAKGVEVRRITQGPVFVSQ